MQTMHKPTDISKSQSSVDLVGVASFEVMSVWQKVYPIIAEAVTAMGETEASILELINGKNAQLWTAQDGGEVIAACVTQLTNHATRKSCSIIICTGRGMADWIGYITTIEAWAKANGCTHMKHDARMGWQKTLKPYGYQATHIVLEKAI